MDTPVNAVWQNDMNELITSTELMEVLRDGVKARGDTTLGIKAEEIGTHSI